MLGWYVCVCDYLVQNYFLFPGDEYDYGKQRVWGTIGYGITALIAGYAVDLFSGQTISYIPAIVVMVIFSVLDLICCLKLKVI